VFQGGISISSVVGFKEKGSGKEMIAGKVGRVCFFCWLCHPFSEHSQDMAKEFFMLWI
jgi:hypothetical protein